MGLADRDYMRENYRRQRHIPTRPGGRYDYQRDRYDFDEAIRRRRRQQLVRFLPFGLSILLIAVPMFGDMKRSGWLPEREGAIPFPRSGSVTVARSLDLGRVTSRLDVQTGRANAVVQLVDPRTHALVISVYVAGDDRVEVPVPEGIFRMRLIEGQKWHGTHRYFGPNTSYESVIGLMEFAPRSGQIIDLRRRLDGNLKTQAMVEEPGPL